MKKTICNIRTLAALLVAGAAFTACSNEDNYVEEAPQYYTMTVKATKDANTTRALSLADPSDPLTSALNASWEDGDVVTVTNSSNEVVGTLTASEASGLTATFSGPIATTVQKDDVLTLTYHPFNGLSAFSAQDGTLASASNLDVATATVTVTDVTGGVITISGTANFTTQTAVVQLILKDTSNNPINATSLNISVMSMNIFTFSPSSTAYTNNGDGILYFALPSQATVATMKGVSSTVLNMATITFTASDGTNTYAASKTGYTFAAGTYYGATVTMTKHAASKALSAVTSSEVGWRIGSDGIAYEATGSLPSGVTAVALICYVGSYNGEADPYNHGLALALSDANGGNACKWKTERTDAGHTKQTSSTFTEESGLQYNDATHNSGTYPAFQAAIANNGTAAPTGCSSWFLASGYQWDKMANAAGSYANLRTNASLGKTGYWSSSELMAGYAWYFDYSKGDWYDDKKDMDYRVRACLAF